MTDSNWFYPRGSLRRGHYDSVVDGSLPGWSHTGLRVAAISVGMTLSVESGDSESVIIPLSGSFEVDYDDGLPSSGTQALVGRPTVFSGPTDVMYLGTGSSFTIRGEGKIAVAHARATQAKPHRYLSETEIPVELRGTGASSRQVHNCGTPDVLDADRIIVCEVLTPANNWSSYPPHKHDENRLGQESNLEEIYYFESAVEGTGQSSDGAFGTFSAYSSPAGEIDINRRVQSGDIALVPFGYHGPAGAAPGYDLYYLNVMAGPGEKREWLIHDDPNHAWVRETWPVQDIDPRLPIGRSMKE
jgi:5-deoxy-glucuronate isomerase